jgi:hypothetical protein
MPFAGLVSTAMEARAIGSTSPSTSAESTTMSSSRRLVLREAPAVILEVIQLLLHDATEGAAPGPV